MTEASMSRRFEGQVGLVTGASRGIGFYGLITAGGTA